VTCFKCGERGYVLYQPSKPCKNIIFILVIMQINVHDLMFLIYAIRIFNDDSFFSFFFVCVCICLCEK
jgi:hypothetical protein